MTDVPQWAVDDGDVQATIAMENLLAMGDQPVEDRTNWLANFIARALADAAKPKWGEPDKTASYVLIAMDDGDVEPGYFDQLYNCWRRHDGSEIERKVIATMPLPPAPEVG